MSNKSTNYIFTIAILTLTLFFWFKGFLQFIDKIPDDNAVINAETTDAIVVLTGGQNRIQTGLELLRKKQAKKLFISGVYNGLNMIDLFANQKDQLQELSCCIVIDYKAQNTLGNAREAAKWIRDENFQSLRLVTSNYHMARSLVEFKRQLPETVIIPHSISHRKIKPKEWWMWPKTTLFLFGEYHKYLVSKLRSYLIQADRL